MTSTALRSTGGVTEDTRWRRRVRRRRLAGVLAGVAALVATVLASIAIGSNPVSLHDVLAVLFSPDNSEASYVVHMQRLPRTVVGIVVGSGLAVAGALMQGLTRNPLADPGLLGVNAGAGLGVTIAISALGLQGPSQYAWVACLGAMLAATLVAVIGSAGHGASPARLLLAGVAVTAVLSAVSMALALMYPETFASYSSWTVGALVGREWGTIAAVAPIIVAGIVIALALGPSLGALSIGEDHARAVGIRVGRVRAAGLLGVTLMCGGATALAGPLAFLGLMVPHAVRRFTGPSQPWIIACCALYGPTLVLFADIVGRVVSMPGEYPVGFMTAIIGGPALIVVMSRSKELR